MKPEYVVIAYGPDHRPKGDQVAREPEDAIAYARHYLDEENRDGACVTINKMIRKIEGCKADHAVADGKRQYGDAGNPHAHDGRMLSSRTNPDRAYTSYRA